MIYYISIVYVYCGFFLATISLNIASVIRPAIGLANGTVTIDSTINLTALTALSSTDILGFISSLAPLTLLGGKSNDISYIIP